MPFRFEFHVKTDVGTQRTRNEDSYLIHEPFALQVVADGMGGHVGGDVASDLATQTILRSFERNVSVGAKPHRRKDGDLLKRAIQEANAEVFTEGSNDPDLRDMGTTVVVAWFRDEFVVLGSVGDSRIYRLRKGAFEQLTTDHSWVGELMRRRLISPDEAAHHPLKNIITRALGMDKKVNIDIHHEDLQEEDLFLLCTDGLTDFVDEPQIAEVLEAHRTDLPAACDVLVEMANTAAGADNVTVGIARVDSGVIDS